MTGAEDPLLDPPREPAAVPDGNGTALAAMILGILSVFCFVTSLPAVICGHLALSEIRRTGSSGRGQAITGLVLGYVFLVILIIALVVPFVLIPYVLEHHSEPQCSQNVRRIVQACEDYAANNDGRYPEEIGDLRGYVSRETLVCPIVIFRQAMAGDPDPDPTYEVVFQGSDPGPDQVIVREDEPRHDGKRVIGFPGGVTELAE